MCEIVWLIFIQILKKITFNTFLFNQFTKYLRSIILDIKRSFFQNRNAVKFNVVLSLERQF